MFKLLAILSGITAALSVLIWAFSGFSNSELLKYFGISLTSAICFLKLFCLEDSVEILERDNKQLKEDVRKLQAKK